MTLSEGVKAFEFERLIVLIRTRYATEPLTLVG